MDKSISIYENAKHWIAQYESVDEVKQYIDKAAAVEEYARRANDYELEHQAARARVRAERRCGELLQGMELSKGAATERGTTELPRLDDIGLTKNQSSKFQQLANVPEEEFEKVINTDGLKPSANGVLKARQQKPKRIDEDALFFWGRLVDLQSKLFHRSVNDLLVEMTPAMQADVLRIAPTMQTWLGGLKT